jgi:hypothetical protein
VLAEESPIPFSDPTLSHAVPLPHLLSPLGFSSMCLSSVRNRGFGGLRLSASRELHLEDPTAAAISFLVCLINDRDSVATTPSTLRLYSDNGVDFTGTFLVFDCAAW